MIACSVMLCSCGPTRQQIEAQQREEAGKAALQNCRAEKLQGIIKTYVDLYRCQNNAIDTYIKPNHSASADLLSVIEAKMLVIGEKQDKNQITEAEAKLEIAQAVSEAKSTEQARQEAAMQAQAAVENADAAERAASAEQNAANAAQRSATAQQNAVNSANAARNNPNPFNCYFIGNTMSCR
jgi:hypothetical protein